MTLKFSTAYSWRVVLIHDGSMMEGVAFFLLAAAKHTTAIFTFWEMGLWVCPCLWLKIAEKRNVSSTGKAENKALGVS